MARTGAPGVVAGRADTAGVTDRTGFACLGFGLGAVTSMVGSRVLPGCTAVGAAAPGVGVSPAARAGDAGTAAGASVPGVGAVCAKVPTQSDEIRKDVEASNRGRNDTEAIGKRTSTAPPAPLRMQTGSLGDAKVPFSPMPSPLYARNAFRRISIERVASKLQCLKGIEEWLVRFRGGNHRPAAIQSSDGE